MVIVGGFLEAEGNDRKRNLLSGGIRARHNPACCLHMGGKKAEIHKHDREPKTNMLALTIKNGLISLNSPKRVLILCLVLITCALGSAIFNFKKIIHVVIKNI